MTFSCEIMDDPVVAADGITYERSAITDWLALHSTSPTTNEPMDSKALFPNVSIRAQIIAWKESHGLPVTLSTSFPRRSTSRPLAPHSAADSTLALQASTAMCPMHHNEPLRAFCITCKKSICSDCAVDSTICKSHITRSVSSIISQLQTEHAQWQHVLDVLPHNNQVSPPSGLPVRAPSLRHSFSRHVAGASRPHRRSCRRSKTGI